MAARRGRRGRGRHPLIILAPLLVPVVLIAVLVGIALVALSRERPTAVFRPPQQCVARSGDHTTMISIDQAWWTAIIVGTSVRRGMPPRAASIAMATVYQETDIRNLDGGDRDSVGLFQQRPSQGWGTVEEIMDPYYSTKQFYDALEKVDGWQNGDINDVAQAVQRSGFPEAYRDHETDGRALATTLTGQTPASFSCLYRDPERDRDGLDAFLERTLGVESRDPGTATPATPDGHAAELVYRTSSVDEAWAVAASAVAVGQRFGTVSVRVGDRIWTHSPDALPEWDTATDPLPEREVRILAG